MAPRLASLPHDSEWLPCLAQLAQTMALVGPHPIARQVYDALEPFADLFAVEGIGAVMRGPVEWFLALTATALGDTPRAQSHFARAIAAAEQFGAPCLVLSIQRDVRSIQCTEPAKPQGVNVFHRAGGIWTIQFGQRELQLRDSLQDLPQLLRRPKVEIAALDLIGARANAGEVLDAAVRDAYRRRLIELEADASKPTLTATLVARRGSPPSAMPSSNS